MRAVEIVEIDLPYCELTYGVAPCEAQLGVTGPAKCFNTFRTCQDKDNFDEGVLTLRFIASDADPSPYDAIPSLASISTTAPVLEPGISMGERESVTVTLVDHMHSDTGIDKYVRERGYDPLRRGTLWGRLRARIPSLRGRALRVYRGEYGQLLSEMHVRHYIIESHSGPHGNSFTIVAKDPLRFLDGDRAQAPSVTPGILAESITDSQTLLRLSPSGVGDAYYPSSGKAAIGGSEIVSFNRTGDVMLITRGQSNTTATSHDAGAVVQLVLEYNSETVANIIYDLITNYTDVDPSWINLSAWQEEVDQYIGRLYSAEIAEPTDVRTLVNELIEQAALVIWSDLEAKQIRMTALRPIGQASELYDTNRIMEGSFSSKEQLDKRVSQVWTYIGLRNPLADLNEGSNYTSVVVTLDNTGADAEYGQPAIKKIYSRWIAANNRPAAERLNDLLLSRYRDPPRRLRWSVYRGDVAPRLGRGVLVKHWDLQDETGLEGTVTAQVVSVEPTEDRYEVEAEELSFGAEPTEKVVIIDTDGFNINLRKLYDEIYSPPSSYDEIVFIVEEGVLIGSTPVPNPDQYQAMTLGRWPEKPAKITLINRGKIVGRGGDGGDSSHAGAGLTAQGRRGHMGLDARRVEGEEFLFLVDNQGLIAGGGGGGGGAPGQAGGGGAGWEASRGGFGHPDRDGSGSGNLDGPGRPGGPNAGAGGDLGQDGESVAGPGTGGGAGFAARGIIDWINKGDLRGPDFSQPLSWLLEGGGS